MNDVSVMEAREADPAAISSGLSVVSIAKSYDKRNVLSDVSLSVGRGEVVGLLGPNGAGKTTCFYSIMGLVKPDSGRIMLDGEDITGLPMYRRAILGLGYLPQETSIFRGLYSLRFGMRIVSTPSLSLASIASVSSSPLSTKLRE